jgi:GNAT superfamily N-acetyltransferase
VPDFTIDLSDAAASDLQNVISDGLGSCNEEQGAAPDLKPLAIAVRDKNGAPIGGLFGRTSMGLLFIDLFYLPKGLRGSSLGTRILTMAEDEGRRRGCTSAVLYTVSFQAPEFYERLGWQAFGEVAPDPGATRIFLTKDLAATAPAA